MPIDRLQRLMWRIRTDRPQQNRIPLNIFQACIIKECGYDNKTYNSVKKALVRLGWIKTEKKYISLTGADIS